MAETRQGGKKVKSVYDEDSIKSLDWVEHIRLRPGMYIGKLGNGTSPDDGIYVLFKEIMDNSVDEYIMGGRQGNRPDHRGGRRADGARLRARHSPGQGRGMRFPD